MNLINLKIICLYILPIVLLTSCNQPTNIDEVRLNFSNENVIILNLSLGFIMFGVALQLRVSNFIQVFKFPKSVLAGFLSQFLALPFFTFLLIQVLQPSPSIALGMILVASCPGGNISNFMTSFAKGNTALSVCMTAIASILAVFMTPLNLSIWGNLYKPTSEIINEISIDFFEMLEIIGVILILPLILGMLLRNYSPKVADGLNKFMQIGSIVIFVGIVYFAFSANFDLFTKYIGAVLFIVLAHNSVGILTGYSIAKLFNLPKEDKKTLAIETGIQNSGLGLGLIFTFFDGLGGMAIIAGWWGIWHILSGLSIAYFFRKKW